MLLLLLFLLLLFFFLFFFFSFFLFFFLQNDRKKKAQKVKTRNNLSYFTMLMIMIMSIMSITTGIQERRGVRTHIRFERSTFCFQKESNLKSNFFFFFFFFSSSSSSFLLRYYGRWYVLSTIAEVFEPHHEQAGLFLIWSHNQNTGFLMMWLIWLCFILQICEF